MKKKPRKAEDISAWTTLAAESLVDANTLKGRIGLRPRAWRATNAPNSARATPPKTTVCSEARP